MRAAIGRWAVGVAVVAVAAGCLAFAAVSPVNVSADEPAHVDYAYQLWQGRLPTFEGGLELRPEGIVVPPVHYAAQHPPLFYALLAPVVGPLAEAGHPRAAVLGARLICAVIAMLCVLALAWAAAQLPTRRPAAWALTTAAVAAPVVPFLRVGGAVYNDDLAVLFTVLALGLAVRLLRHGWSVRLLVTLGVVCGLGALSRATFVITLIAVTAALAVAGWVHADGGRPRRLAVGVGLATLPVLSAVLAAGWFYRRNVELSGSWTGGHPDYAESALGRTTRPLLDVLTDGVLWRIPLELWRQSAEHPATLATALVPVLAVVGLLGAAVRGGRGARPGRDQILTIALLVAQAVGTMLLTASYISLGGGTSGRYLLPALLPLALLLAAGVLAGGRVWAGLALLTYGAAAWIPFLRWILDQPQGEPGSTLNGVPWWPVWIALGVLVAAVVAQAGALTVLAGRPDRPALSTARSRRTPVPA